jgi:agmatine deiminase
MNDTRLHSRPSTLRPAPDSGALFMPAETDPHAACWMCWPSRAGLWGDRLADVKREYALIARTIAEYEPVTMVANGDAVAEAGAMCGPSVSIFAAAIDDSWMRDSGPTFLVDRGGGTALVNWRFNAWGAKYQPHAADASLKAQIAHRIGLPLIETFLVAEGGALLSDGEGTILTTESCLLNSNRNPGIEKRDIERELLRCLGAQKVVWLPGDVTETETDGHIDGLASIARPGLVVLESCDDPSDPRFAVLEENRRALAAQADARGRSFEVIKIGEADAAQSDSPRFCRSYVNFYIANGAVIMPAYGIASDQAAQAAVAAAFPDRKIVPLKLEAVPLGGGSIHCITQQQPAPRTTS